MKFSALAIPLALLLSSCLQQKQANPGKPVVSVSILPQKYFIEQLAGDKVEVNVLVPPGASPETYEPSVSQLSQLDRSSIYMKIGYLGFELGWMAKILSVNPGLEIINLSEGMELIYGREVHEEDEHQGNSHTHEGIDPHIWMSARNARILAGTMAEALKNLLPDDSIKIAHRHSELLGRIDSLDLNIGNVLAEAKGNSFMIYHPSLSYFARDYGLEQLALEWEGKTPSPSHMKKLSDLGRKLQITTILIQHEFDSKNASILATEIGARIVPINPLDEDWPAQMLNIALKLSEQW